MAPTEESTVGMLVIGPAPRPGGPGGGMPRARRSTAHHQVRTVDSSTRALAPSQGTARRVRSLGMTLWRQGLTVQSKPPRRSVIPKEAPHGTVFTGSHGADGGIYRRDAGDWTGAPARRPGWRDAAGSALDGAPPGSDGRFLDSRSGSIARHGSARALARNDTLETGANGSVEAPTAICHSEGGAARNRLHRIPWRRRRNLPSGCW